MAVALLVAGGSGTRLGASEPKAFVPVAGRSMLFWCLEALRAVPAVTDIVVAIPPFAHLISDVTTVQGGDTRSESVLAALGAAPEGDPILVHDAARPLATPALFARCIAALDELGADAVVAALPVTDTIKQVVDGSSRVESTLDRSRLWAVQTPQVFRRAVLETALEGELWAATDDAWLVEQMGGEVHVVPGEPDNFKITVPADLRAAELVLGAR